MCTCGLGGPSAREQRMESCLGASGGSAASDPKRQEEEEGSSLRHAFVCAVVRRSPAPLCDPRRCAREGGRRMAGRGLGAEGGAPFTATGPALRPIDRTLLPSGGRQGKRRPGSAAARRASLAARGHHVLFYLSLLGRPCLPSDRLLAVLGRGSDPPPSLPLLMDTISSSGGPGPLTCGQVQDLGLSTASGFWLQCFLLWVFEKATCHVSDLQSFTL
jgi:hypothetical protein